MERNIPKGVDEIHLHEIAFTARIRYPFLSKQFPYLSQKIAVLFFPSLENTSVTFETEKIDN